MALPRLAAAIWPSAATLRASAEPLVERYAVILGIPGLFYYADDNAEDDNDWTIIRGDTWTGAYVRRAFPDQGDDLAGSSATVYVTDGPWRVLPAASLSGNITLTLSVTGAREGDPWELTRLDVGAYTVAVANGGPAAGTLCTMPVSSRAWGLFYFNGTNWTHRRSGLML